MNRHAASLAQREKISQLCEVTGSNPRIALQCLNMSDWNVQAAVHYYYTSGVNGTDPAPKVNSALVNKLYEKYKDADTDSIQAAGISAFCDDLKVEADDVVMLVLSWHFHAETMLEFSKKEFTQGLTGLGCDSIEKLRSKLPALRVELENPSKFQAIYNFAYLFSREKGIKCVQQDMAIAVWRLLLLPSRWPLIEDWCEFLERHHNRAISRDTWSQLFHFIQTVDSTFNGYDETGSWPYLLDDFVDYMRTKRARAAA